ncbi:MAG TPA: DUF362 domain-containing protein [Longimicrobium sp.]
MNVVSVCRDGALAYPAPHDHSPPEPFPESPFPGAPPGGNRVYALVRRALQASGADAGRFGTPAWNPLGEWILPGQRVFVLPNLVVERRPGEPEADFRGKCTHGSVLRAVLDYAALAAGGAERVRFGNASLQSCDYASVAAETGAAAVGAFWAEHDGDRGPLDLRATVTRWTRFGALLERRTRHPEDVVHVDLGADSLLDELYRGGPAPEFRVGDYDHREMAEYHAPGRHVYAVHRAVLEADAIVSVPKLKTHEKVGITCALKGTVGAIARKECLAHHRKGGAGQGGDEYPGGTPVHLLASEMADRVTTMDAGVGANLVRVASKGLYRALRVGPGIMAGGWHGNDTAWRMALDIARILRFARADGTLASTPQRTHLVLVDGIVGGEAEGPVYPRGNPCGAVVFGSDPVWADVACARVMGFDPAAIPLVARALDPLPYPATELREGDVHVMVDGSPAGLEDLNRVLERGFVPPKGWKGHVEAGRLGTAAID